MFYVTTDLKSSRVFVAPMGKVEKPFLIEFESKWHADQALKKFNSGRYKSPVEHPENYSVKETKRDLVLPGDVLVFELK